MRCESRGRRARRARGRCAAALAPPTMPMRYQTTPATTATSDEHDDAERAASPRQSRSRSITRARRPVGVDASAGRGGMLASARRAVAAARTAARSGRRTGAPRTRARAGLVGGRRTRLDLRARAECARTGGSAGEVAADRCQRPHARTYQRASGRTAMVRSGSADDEVDHAAGHDDDLAHRRAVEQRGDALVGAGRGLVRVVVGAGRRRVTRARTLPLTCTGTSTCRRRATRDRPRGTARTRASPACPSRAHSSSATCGVSGASISTIASHHLLAARSPARPPPG